MRAVVAANPALAIRSAVNALLPNHQRALLPKADHRLSQDNPAGFAALMDGFIEALGRQAG